MEDDQEGAAARPTDVPRRILADFLDALAREEGLDDVAARLRETLLARGETGEGALRASIFPVDVS